MDLIINFYKGLDTLNLIIFWGIIIVIILLLIFSYILLNKSKKIKKNVEPDIIEQDLPIINKIDTIVEENQISEEIDNNLNSQKSIIENELDYQENVSNSNYNQDNQTEDTFKESVTPDIKKTETKVIQPIEIPNKPYQRNVLREMSLSQTSPIGINRQVPKEDKKIEMIKDLEESLNTDELYVENNNEDHRLTNIPNHNNDISITKNENNNELLQPSTYNIKNIEETPAFGLLNEASILDEQPKVKNDSEKYLEEVSRKLSEADVPDEIERTNYELQQEEEAIISYKELMEKKDTIQTIDEEEAVISIEELMNRTNSNQQVKEEEYKLYNLTEEEANDNFIKELKQFRNDL